MSPRNGCISKTWTKVLSIDMLLEGRKFHRVPPQTKNCTQLRTAGEARISLWEGGAAGRKEKGKSNGILIVKNVLKREDTMFSALLVYSSWHLLLQCLTTLFCYLVVENKPERK